MARYWLLGPDVDPTPAVEEEAQRLIPLVAAPPTPAPWRQSAGCGQWRPPCPSGPASTPVFTRHLGAGCFPPMRCRSPAAGRACRRFGFHWPQTTEHISEVVMGQHSPSPSVRLEAEQLPPGRPAARWRRSAMGAASNHDGLHPLGRAGDGQRKRAQWIRVAAAPSSAAGLNGGENWSGRCSQKESGLRGPLGSQRWGHAPAAAMGRQQQTMPGPRWPWRFSCNSCCSGHRRMAGKPGRVM